MTSTVPEVKLTDYARSFVEERYLWTDPKTGQQETVEGMFRRVAEAVAMAESTWGTEQAVLGYRDKFYALMASLDFLPSSPTLLNAGTGSKQAWASCYVLPIEDTIEGIFDAVKAQAIIQASSGGTGFSFSKLRAKGALVRSSGGKAGGPVSFLRVFNEVAEQIQQGGKRQGANMAVLDVSHPDLYEFIECKLNGGIDHFNISVGISDAFMDALAGSRIGDYQYAVIDPETGKVLGTRDARETWRRIVECAWKSGDPGLVFLDRINNSSANPFSSVETISATNPCLAGDTLLYTAWGLRTVKSLFDAQIPLVVATDGRFGKGRFNESTPVFQTGVKPVYRLKTVEGYEVRLTAEHKVMTDRGYVPAGDLRDGDRIHILNSGGGFGQGGSLEMGQVFGWIVGDGYLENGSSGRVGLDFYGEKRELVDYFVGVINLLVDGMQLADRVYTVGAVAIRDRNQLSVRSTRLGRLAEQWGLSKEEVPVSIFAGSEDLQRGYLQALFTADGTVNKAIGRGASIRLTAISESLLVDVQRLLLNFGIFSRLYRNRLPAMVRSLPNGKGGKSDYPTQAYHELVVSKANMVTFRDRIGLLLDRKQRDLDELLDSYGENGPYAEQFVTRVLSITLEGDEPVYDITVDSAHSMSANGIIVSNCGEQPLSSWDACTLGSINLSNFLYSDAYRGQVTVDFSRLEEVTRLAVRFLDNVLSVAPWPLPQIAETTHGNRRIGLGVMGWADLLYKLGIPYDSQAALDLAEEVMDTIQDAAWVASRELAEVRGPFARWKESDAYKRGDVPSRNSAITTIAPTGSIAIIAGVSSGIEPVFALAFHHKATRPDGTVRDMYIVNEPFREALVHRFQDGAEAIIRDVSTRKDAPGSIEGLGLGEDFNEAFVTAYQITPAWHVRMQAAFQAHVDNAVSKTVNLPNSATVDDIDAAYMMAWETGCKGITVYRDGSKDLQVLYAGDSDNVTPSPVPEQAPEIRDISAPMSHPVSTFRTRDFPVMPAVSSSVETASGHVYVNVTMAPDGPLEAFVLASKAGSEIAAVAEAIGRLTSLVLRLPDGLTPDQRMEEIVAQLVGIGGPNPVGFGNQRVMSLPDAVGKALNQAMQQRAISETAETVWDMTTHLATEAGADYFAVARRGGDLCPECGESALVRSEGCQTCLNCGYSKC